MGKNAQNFLGQRVGGHDRGGSGRARELHDEEPDRSTAEDAYSHARPNVPQADGVEGDSKGLEHRDVCDMEGRVCGHVGFCDESKNKHYDCRRRRTSC